MQNKQAMYFSIIGLIVFMGWFMASIFCFNFLVIPKTILPVLTNFLNHFNIQFLNWNLYAFTCFIVGVHIYLHIETKSRFKSFLLQFAAIIIISLGFAWVNSFYLVIIPIAFFCIFLRIIHQKNPKAVSTIFWILLLLLPVLSFFSDNVIEQSQLFAGLFNTIDLAYVIRDINQIYSSANTMLQLFYGFLIIIMGFWAGKTRWLVEYHFHYNELKKLFKYSLALLILWVLLNYFGIYLLIAKWKIGEIFFLFDGLTINIVLVFMYLFLLIYLENFSFGKLVLKLLESMGKMWFVNMLLLFAILYIVTQVNVQLSFGGFVLGLITFFGLISFLSYLFGKLYYNFWLRLIAFIDKI